MLLNHVEISDCYLFSLLIFYDMKNSSVVCDRCWYIWYSIDNLVYTKFGWCMCKYDEIDDLLRYEFKRFDIFFVLVILKSDHISVVSYGVVNLILDI